MSYSSESVFTFFSPLSAITAYLKCDFIRLVTTCFEQKKNLLGNIQHYLSVSNHIHVQWVTILHVVNFMSVYAQNTGTQI